MGMTLRAQTQVSILHELLEEQLLHVATVQLGNWLLKNCVAVSDCLWVELGDDEVVRCRDQLLLELTYVGN